MSVAVWIALSVFILITFLLYCCILAGNDPLERRISDQEQSRYLSEWNKHHPNHKSAQK